MTPNTGRFEALETMIRDYQIDGVIEIILHCCHTYAIESQLVKEFVTEQRRLPFLSLTTDYSTSDSGQIATRIGAFLEMIDTIPR